MKKNIKLPADILKWWRGNAHTHLTLQKKVASKVTMKAIIEPDVPKHMLKKDVQKYTKIKKIKDL